MGERFVYMVDIYFDYVVLIVVMMKIEFFCIMTESVLIVYDAKY
jgi:hypothetical protein